MPRYVLHEDRTDTNFASRIDKEAGIVKDVMVLGLTSPTRKRRYNPKGVKKALELYANKPVNIDHPESEKVAGRPRSFTERFGKILNPRFVEGQGIKADLQYNPKHEKAAVFEWWVENSPELIGLSHNADALGKMANDGWVDIDEITKVRSVDLVADGGTTQSLFEGALVERYKERTELKKVIEISSTAMDLIRGTMFEETDMTVEQKKKNILEVVEEWSDLLQDKTSQKTTTIESKDMDLKDLTLEQLKKERSDLYQMVLNESATNEELKKSKEKITLLETKLDETQLKLALHDRAALVRKKLEEAKLPEVAVTETFKKQLMEARDETQVGEIIQDRIKILESSKEIRSKRGNSDAPSTTGSLSVDELVSLVK